MKRVPSLALAGLLLLPSCLSEKPVPPTDRPNAAVEEGVSGQGLNFGTPHPGLIRVELFKY